MNKIYLLAIDSTLKTFSVIDGGVGIRYERNEQFGNIKLAEDDILLGFVSQGVNEFRSAYRVLSIDDESIELEKEIERAEGISIDKFLPQIATAVTDLLGGAEIVEADQEVSAVIYNMLLGKRVALPKMSTIGSLQLITYGAPGTGKSWKTDKLISDGQIQCFRTTFHPDSDYSTFVGAYKPTKNASGLTYEFVPQTFVKAYKAAWRDTTKPVALVVEEINRGNCAQIFGDLFQLLDRKDDGYSAYPIDADSDLEQYLSVAFENASISDAEIKSGKKLVLPPNLYIWATMNTSDQSLFPIDSAFKRRWDWEYVPISNPHDKDQDFIERKVIVGENKYDWWKFITKVNDCILDVIKSEDKQLGYFFVKAPDATGEITAKQFVNKVLFYLFNDVFKDYALPDAIFGKQNGGNKYAFKDFFLSDGSVNESTLTQYFGDLGIEAE